MQYKLYVDILWVTLCLVDLAAMLGMTWLLKFEKRLIRCVLLAVLSASIEVVLYVVMPYYWSYRILVLCIVNPILVVGLLFPSSKLEYVKGYFVTTGFLLLIGGLQTLFLNYFPMNPSSGFWLVILSFWIVFLYIFLRRRNMHNDFKYEVELQIDRKVICTQGYRDTGNLLIDPYSGKPVSVIDVNLIDDISNIMIRYIPYHTVGQNSNLLPVVTAEWMVVRQGEFYRRIERPVIGFSQNRLFLKEDVHMILHSDLF